MIKLKRVLPRTLSGAAMILGATYVVTVLTILALTDHLRLAIGLTVVLTFLGFALHVLQRREAVEKGAPKRLRPTAVLVGVLVTVVGTIGGTALILGTLYLWLLESGYGHEELALLLLEGWLAYLIALCVSAAGGGIGGYVAARLARQRERPHATAAAVAAFVPCWLFLANVFRTLPWRPGWWTYALLALPAALVGGAMARDAHGRAHPPPRRRPLRPGSTDGHPTQPSVVWSLRDILLVTLCYIGCGVIFGLVDRIVLQGMRFGAILRAYADGLLKLGLPILCLRRWYGIPLAALGLQRGVLHPLTSVALGIGLGGAYYFLLRGYLGQEPIGVTLSLAAAVLFPLTLRGFSITVSTPLSEEVMFRGFVYPSLRNVWGSRLALLLQALLFSGLHRQSYSSLTFALETVLCGLMLGLAYEKTKSLYPAIACHGALNYLALLGAAF